jgi:hypothetical protein
MHFQAGIADLNHFPHQLNDRSGRNGLCKIAILTPMSIVNVFRAGSTARMAAKG